MVSIGIDLERIERFAFLHRPSGSAFYTHVFTCSERVRCGDNLVLLALCFTAKEAVSKVLGTGLLLSLAENSACQEIEIMCTRGQNQPQVTLRGKAATRAICNGFSELILYWCHNSQFACALAGGAQNTLEAIELRAELPIALRAVMTSISPDRTRP